MKSKLYRVTFLCKGNDEQVIEAHGKSGREAIQNALYRVNHHEFSEYIELIRGALFDENGEIHPELPEGRKWLEGVFYTRNGGRVFLPDFVVSLDETETVQAPVNIRRGDELLFVTPSWGGNYHLRAIAWLPFENHHGSGWVMFDQYDPAKRYNAYLYEITEVNGSTVEFDQTTGGLVDYDLTPVEVKA